MQLIFILIGTLLTVSLVILGDLPAWTAGCISCVGAVLCAGYFLLDLLLGSKNVLESKVKTYSTPLLLILAMIFFIWSALQN
jgi:hypothetical protein